MKLYLFPQEPFLILIDLLFWGGFALWSLVEGSVKSGAFFTSYALAFIPLCIIYILIRGVSAGRIPRNIIVSNLFVFGFSLGYFCLVQNLNGEIDILNVIIISLVISGLSLGISSLSKFFS